MGKTVLLDSGPLVAALRERDAHHAWAVGHLDATATPFVTCEAVLSESFFLLDSAPRGKERLCSLLERGLVTVDFTASPHLGDLLRLMRRYSDTPMSFADACLVRMSELRTDSVVLTIDSDFLTYRRSGRQTIPVLMP